jgi:hypothetical protein
MPRIPRIGPGEVVPIRPVRPDDLGSGVGQAAYAGAAQDLGAISARLIGAEREAQVAGAEAGYGAKLAELTQQIEQHPNADEREGMFEEGRKELSEEFRGTLTGQQYQAAFDQRAFQLGERAKLAVREGVIRKRLDTAKGGVIEAVDKFDRLIEHAESDQRREGYIFARSNILDAGVAGGSISAAERAQIEERSRAALEEIGLDRKALQVANAVTGEESDPARGLAKVRDMITENDPRLLAKTLAHAKDIYYEKNLAKTQAEAKQKDELVRRVFSTGPDKLTHAQLASMDIDGGLRMSLEHEMTAQENAALSGQADVKTNQAAYFEGKDILLDPRREKERETFDPYTYAPGKLSKAARDELVKLTEAPDPQEAQINAEVKRYSERFLPKTTTSAGREADFAYREAVEDAIQRKRIAKGSRHLDDNEIDEVLMGQLKVEVEGEYWGKSAVPTYKFLDRYDPEDVARVVIPPLDRKRIGEKLQKDGITPTDALVREVFLDEIGLPQPPEPEALTVEPEPRPLFETLD